MSVEVCVSETSAWFSILVTHHHLLVRFFFSFSHLADIFIQSDLQVLYIHFTSTLMAHCTSGAIRGFSVLLKDASTVGIELATFCLLSDFFTSCTTVAPMSFTQSKPSHHQPLLLRTIKNARDQIELYLGTNLQRF